MKRSTRRKLKQGILYAILVAAVVVLALLANWTVIRSNFFDWQVAKKVWPAILTEGARNTVVYTAIAFAGGLVLALFLALMKLSSVTPYRWLATIYIEFFRGLPALMVIIVTAYAIPLAFQWHPPGGNPGAGLIGLIAVAGAYMAETLRAGIQAVPKGQREAAHSLGMSEGWTMVSVILPQAIRIIIPPLTNEFVLLLKDTSLLSIAGVTVGQNELTSFSQDKLNTYGNATPLMVAAVMYLIITLPLTQLVAHLERRTQKAR